MSTSTLTWILLGLLILSIECILAEKYIPQPLPKFRGTIKVYRRCTEECDLYWVGYKPTSSKIYFTRIEK